jgi:hypothetical protein
MGRSGPEGVSDPAEIIVIARPNSISAHYLTHHHSLEAVASIRLRITDFDIGLVRRCS